jgi:hypothetical protein
MSRDLDYWCINTLHTRAVPSYEMWPCDQPKHTGVEVTKEHGKWRCSAHLAGRCRHVRMLIQHYEEMGVELP